MELLKDLFSIAASIGGILFIFIKFGNDLFLEIVRPYIKELPSNKNILSLIVKIIVCLIVASDLMMIINSLGNGLNNKNSVDFNDLSLEVIKGVAGVIAIIGILAFVVAFSLKRIIDIKNEFINKLKNKVVDIKKCKYIRIIILMNTIICCIFVIGLLHNANLELTNHKKVSNEFIIANGSIFLFFIIYLLLLILSIKSYEITRELKFDKYYVIKKKDNIVIVCSTYLQVGKYILIYENGKERYISNDEVDEIIID